jgi:capsular polysaccharide transport system permease protein
VNALDKKLHLRAHYSNSRIDWINRLSAHAPDDVFLSYFRKRVSVDVMMGGYLVVAVQAYDPEYAATIAEEMAAGVDRMVQELSGRAHRDELSFAEKELQRAESRLVEANLAITQFRNEHRDFDPQAKAQQLESTVVGGLESQLVQYRAELANVRDFQEDNSPAITALKSQIAALEQQISGERKRIGRAESRATKSSTGADMPYSELASTYSQLTDNAQFARDYYLSAKQAFDLARANAARREQYVECFVKPNAPQRPTAPDAVRVILSIFLVSLLIYVAGSLLVSAFREQAGG